MGSRFREQVKIYATDVDEDALNNARQASYTERETRGLPESYRERYFDLVNGRYIFTPDLRRSVIFGRNDLTSDAPISRIDILLCRNTLIVFQCGDSSTSRQPPRLCTAPERHAFPWQSRDAPQSR